LGAAPTMLRLCIYLFLFLAVSGCTPVSDRGEQSVEVLVPGHQSPSLVLYSPHRGDNCTGTSQRSREIVDGAPRNVFRDGYYYVDFEDNERSYRAFFQESHISAAPHHAAFIFCAKGRTPIAAGCSVVGVSPKGCFFTGYGIYKLSEIGGFVDQIQRNYPW
ncbi:hypothetical protein ACW7G0_14205, partial [Lysobacter sp. A286]